MRCIGCGEEMRLVQAVADHTMMVPGYEHHTLECLGCHEVERRLVFTKAVAPTPINPMQPSAEAPASTTAPERNDRADAPSTWERALDRLRSQQSSLEERAAGAKTSEAKRQSHQTWDGFLSRRRNAPPANLVTPAQEPARPAPTTVASGKDGTPHAATATGALARVAAKLRSHQATMDARGAVKEHSLEGQPFEQLWDNVGPSARRPTPLGKPPAPRCAPLPRSRSLVPIDNRPAPAPSTWARAVAMLNAWQGSA
jgi:hypothetical protein